MVRTCGSEVDTHVASRDSDLYRLGMSEVAVLALTLCTTLVGAFVGAFASSRFAYQQQAFSERDKQRREAADATLPPLLTLRRLLRNAEKSRSNKEWAEATEAAYEALDDVRHMLPPSLRHLKRSVRISLGEAMGGVAAADVDPRMLDYELEPYNYRWVSFAEEYLGEVINLIRLWRDASRSSASSIKMMDFDDWLRSTGRYPFEG